jgi:2-polyprenyl-3-methyl-5-hydroxy-6-metoxy-1,4-benzoquinol methylase
MCSFSCGVHERLRRLIFPFGMILEEIPEKSRVLDIGSGYGAFPIMVARERIPERVLGVEIDRERVKAARRSSAGLGNVGFVVGDFSGFRTEERFDVITCLDVLHHVPKNLQRGVVEKAGNLLREGGSLILVEIGSRPLLKYAWNYVHDIVMTRSLGMSYIPRERCLEMVKSGGLRVASVRDASRFMYSRYMITARKG